jgi:hypothetical protein
MRFVPPLTPPVSDPALSPAAKAAGDARNCRNEGGRWGESRRCLQTAAICALTCAECDWGR